MAVLGAGTAVVGWPLAGAGATAGASQSIDLGEIDLTHGVLVYVLCCWVSWNPGVAHDVSSLLGFTDADSLLEAEEYKAHGVREFMVFKDFLLGSTLWLAVRSLICNLLPLNMRRRRRRMCLAHHPNCLPFEN